MPVIILLAVVFVLSLCLAALAYRDAKKQHCGTFEAWTRATIGFFIIPAIFMTYSLYKRFGGNFGMFGLGGFELLLLAVSTSAAIVSYRLAKRRNREAGLWAFLCFLLPLLVILLLCLGVLPKEEA